MGVFNLFLLISLFAVIKVESGQRSESGNINISGSTFRKIRVPRGRRIVLQINRLELEPKGYVELQDGNSGPITTFTAFRSDIFDRFGVPMPFPYKYETTRSKLSITISRGRNGGLSARYASYNPDLGCRKDKLYSGTADSDSDCNSDVLSPVATTCDVTIACNKNYMQYRTERTCDGDRQWTGDFDCLPKRNLLETCTYNFENSTVNEKCPFAPVDIAKYYVDVIGADPYDVSLGRSGRRQINCLGVCALNGFGGYAVRCPQRMTKRNRNLFARCFICRVVRGCKDGRIF